MGAPVHVESLLGSINYACIEGLQQHAHFLREVLNFPSCDFIFYFPNFNHLCTGPCNSFNSWHEVLLILFVLYDRYILLLIAELLNCVFSALDIFSPSGQRTVWIFSFCHVWIDIFVVTMHLFSTSSCAVIHVIVIRVRDVGDPIQICVPPLMRESAYCAKCLSRFFFFITPSVSIYKWLLTDSYRLKKLVKIN